MCVIGVSSLATQSPAVQNCSTLHAMSTDWSPEEVHLAVASYLGMLAFELEGTPYNKAEANRALQKLLPGRSRSAIEKKHQNTSAALLELGFPCINGYKPLGNLQQLQREIVEQEAIKATHLHRIALIAAEMPVAATPSMADILAMQVAPPSPEERSRVVYDTVTRQQPPQLRNYLQIEARNHSLGRAGEELVLRFEAERLQRSGAKRLADRIEHVAKTQGDGLGFDILSFEPTGEERLIEVKTTRFGQMTPFFASRNEVDFSDKKYTGFHLYRLFNFGTAPQLFMLHGSLRQTCSLDPIEFRARPV